MGGLALFCKMAMRSIRKYRRRSLQSGAAIFIGVFFVAVADAFMAGFAARVTRDFITEGGHVVVTAPGYSQRREMMPLDRLIAGTASALRALEEVGDDVRAFPSLGAAGLVSPGGTAGSVETESAAVLCVGLLPETGETPNPACGFVKGRIAAGRFFSDASEAGMVLAAKTAEAIGAAPGDTVVFLCSDKYGGFSAVELKLLGVFSSGASFSGASCFIDLASMRSVLGAEDEAAEIAAYVVDSSGVPRGPREVAQSIRALEGRVAELGLVSERWDQASGDVASMLEFMDTFMVIMYVLFAVVAVVGITNSILLSVQDRIRDFGTLRAIAFTRTGVSAMVAIEALVLGAVASLLAVLAAWGVSAYFAVNGIALPGFAQQVATWMPADLRPATGPVRLLASFAVGTAVPVIAALYPIAVLRRISIREALGFV